MTELPMLSTVVHEAVQKERLEIIRMLHAEAAKHQDAAEKLRADYDYREVGDDVHAHESDARLIDRLADLILCPHASHLGPRRHDRRDRFLRITP